ncbi:MAG: hypothetical protein HYY21_04490 [Candidatus Tectomicrobia bacterium]|nr:hypothetical protein [Candidatus Tectomicrobia bacterium]
MKRVGQGFIGAILILALVSCTPWRDTYLTEGVNRATQDDVTKRLGPPHFQRELTGGGTVWTYQQQHVSFFETGTRTTGQSYCLEYVLIFDRERVLREWRTQDC